MNNPSSEYDSSTGETRLPRADHAAQPASDFVVPADEAGRIRKRYTGTFKAAVVLEALEGKQSIQELATRHQLHPNQIRNWKSLFRKRLPHLFEDRRLCNESPCNLILMNDDTTPDEG